MLLDVVLFLFTLLSSCNLWVSPGKLGIPFDLRLGSFLEGGAGGGVEGGVEGGSQEGEIGVELKGRESVAVSLKSCVLHLGGFLCLLLIPKPTRCSSDLSASPPKLSSDFDAP